MDFDKRMVVSKINTRLIWVVLVVSLSACSHFGAPRYTHHLPEIPLPPEVAASCETAQESIVDRVLRTLMLDVAERRSTLAPLEASTEGEAIVWRAALLTHPEMSYRELREAERLLTGLDRQVLAPKSQWVIQFLLMLNQQLQAQKSERVLLKRQAEESRVQAQQLQAQVNALQSKIDALTDIEKRMKHRVARTAKEESP